MRERGVQCGPLIALPHAFSKPSTRRSSKSPSSHTKGPTGAAQRAVHVSSNETSSGAAESHRLAQEYLTPCRTLGQVPIEVQGGVWEEMGGQ